MSEWYFAYGSNLWIDQMIERTGPVHPDKRPMMARLPHHRLVFNMLGEQGEVYANLMYPGNGVLGVVYHCSQETLKIMDAHESGYQQRDVRVVLENGAEVSAIAYFAEAARIGNESQPRPEYLQRILDGARQHGLPEVYIQEIEATAQAKSAD